MKVFIMSKLQEREREIYGSTHIWKPQKWSDAREHSSQEVSFLLIDETKNDFFNT